MKTFLVKWEKEIEADTPEEAAEKAKVIQSREVNNNQIFIVNDEKYYVDKNGTCVYSD